MHRIEHIISGHAPGHIRGPFQQAIQEEFWPYSPETLRLAGRLWNCTDTMPGNCCALLDLPAGSTYAQAARRLRAVSA